VAVAGCAAFAVAPHPQQASSNPTVALFFTFFLHMREIVV
jgi:hypothetical protein